MIMLTSKIIKSSSDDDSGVAVSLLKDFLVLPANPEHNDRIIPKSYFILDINGRDHHDDDWNYLLGEIAGCSGDDPEAIFGDTSKEVFFLDYFNFTRHRRSTLVDFNNYFLGTRLETACSFELVDYVRSLAPEFASLDFPDVQKAPGSITYACSSRFLLIPAHNLVIRVPTEESDRLNAILNLLDRNEELAEDYEPYGDGDIQDWIDENLEPFIAVYDLRTGIQAILRLMGFKAETVDHLRELEIRRSLNPKKVNPKFKSALKSLSQP